MKTGGGTGTAIRGDMHFSTYWLNATLPSRRLLPFSTVLRRAK